MTTCVLNAGGPGQFENDGVQAGGDVDIISQACQLLVAAYEIDAVGAADVLRVGACAVGLDAHALARRIVGGVGTDSTPSHSTVDALLMDVD